MADPATLAMTGMGSSIAGGGLGIFSALSGAKAKKDQYNYQAQVADINANIAKQNADYALQSGEKQSVILGMKQAQQESGVRNAQSASGLDINSGSNAEVQASQKLVDRMDATQQRENTARTAYNYQVQATGYQNSAALARAGADNAETEGLIGAATSVVGAAGSVSDKWYKA